MKPSRRPLSDSSLPLLAAGYAWLPSRLRRAGAPVVRARLLGRHTVALHGPEAVRFFYDERHVRRGGALPEPVRGTLFGKGGVHGLDGQAHRARKAMFLSLLADEEQLTALAGRVAAAWDRSVASWPERERVVLFDEAGRIITEGVCGWAGIPQDEGDVAPVARDLLAMVDGFATAGPRHWRARRARGRQERRLARLVNDVRAGTAGPGAAPAGTAADVVARHRDVDGRPLTPGVAAVELLNFIRPAAAVSWFVAYAAHALHRRPEYRARLCEGDPDHVGAFVHEVRRFYPFAPFVGGRAVTDVSWRGHPVPAGALVLLDVYGQHHDEGLWADPYRFRPERFLDRPPRGDELVPQGGGPLETGHRCPGEAATVRLLKALVPRLARLDYRVPPQDLTISLRRIPARPRSGFVIVGVRPPADG
ncbi:cytochrome P450 [Streptomyces sp. MP131-18]|uniref:cytochrome P450 n=1 Tax=Streptomyces sp. MP131-18 TaxID=1857892 RepID=UPI00097C177C|nr:cytochrome P450 [Streptomyces sp. MP131-18]ONK11060.1 Fatty-acid peroxygenase [Streptomyces sp. MP131-18]